MQQHTELDGLSFPVPTSWHSYPKVYGLGHPETEGILEHAVVCEEKVDGSQFSFASIGGELRCRSKGVELNVNAPEALFAPAVATARELFESGLLVDGWTYRAETLQKPKHNALAYDRVPSRNLIVFDVNPGFERYLSYDDKAREAARIGLEVVPRLFEGRLTHEVFERLLDTVSVLGGQKIEGFVIKPVAPVYGRDKKAVLAKFVSEAFKEVHAKVWGEQGKGRGSVVDRVVARYRSEARWEKAIQHLHERGELLNAPQDIGNLIQEVQRDVFEEEGESIMRMIFSDFERDVRSGIVRGLPEWYKMKLAESAFE